MASYNGEAYIDSQIRSILKQLSAEDEIIVSDDGSTDGTIDVILRINDSRIKIVHNSGERGYTSNFENALKYSANDVIFLSDQDDVWCENKVERCLEALKSYDLVVHDAIITDARLISKNESFFQQRRIFESASGNILKFSYLGCCMAFNRAVLKKALPFPSNHKLCTHDNWLFLIGSTFFKHKVLHDRLIFYRRHNENTSTGGKKNALDLVFMVRYRLYLIVHLILRIFAK